MKKQKIAASFKNFHVIAHDLDETQDLKAECKEQLGEGVRLLTGTIFLPTLRLVVRWMSSLRH